MQKDKLTYLLKRVYSFPLVLALLTLFNIKLIYIYMTDLRTYTLYLGHLNTFDKVLQGKRMLVNINIESLSKEELKELKSNLEKYFGQTSK